jgi:hypothetical protein
VTLAVYVAAPFAEAPAVRAAHGRLVARGHRRTSRWADDAHGLENLAALDDAARERIRLANHGAIRASDAMIVLGAPGGCETLVELGIALALCLPIVWVDGAARPPLSATCTSVCTRVRSLDAAIELLEQIARRAAA